MRRVIAAAVLAAGLAVVPAPADASTSRGIAPCEYEDGSSQVRCVWDGGSMGNGVGLSYIVRNGGTERERVRYVSHRRAHRLVAAYRRACR